MRFNQLKLNDKALFNKFLNARRHELSVYSFANIFIWRDLFRIFWAIIDDNVCIFFQDRTGTFMYLPPIGAIQTKKLIEKCFEIMDSSNQNSYVSRIENIQESDLEFYRSAGYECRYKTSDYIYNRDRLSRLKGNHFKPQRASLNYFLKHYQFKYQPFDLEYRKDCFMLYKDWMLNRKKKFNESVYLAMLEENFIAQRQAISHYHALDLTGRVVTINNRVKAYTLGFRLNSDTFCILFETTDLGLKGISQFIFHRFVEELKEYRYINVMDDSGLENLRRVKLSYRPLRLIPSYIVGRRPDGKRYQSG